MSKESLVEVVDRFQPQKIMVIGDMMLDQYSWGDVSRISPEAPIPVLKVEKEEFRLGGAASAVANVQALNCVAFPLGIIGKDRSGEKIKDILQELGVSMEGILEFADYSTILKNRMLTKQQQLLRVDHESDKAFSDHHFEILREKFDKIVAKVDGIIISDYQKGVLTQEILQYIIHEGKRRGIPIICDPGRGVDFTWYKGITAIKPNRHEAAIAAQISLNDPDSILQAADIIKQKCEADIVTISLDKEGILLFKNKDDYEIIKTEAKEVYDVTGAGDMVISVLGILFAAGESPENSVRVANIAAGLEITHIGAVPIPWSDIRASLLQDHSSPKIVTLKTLKQILYMKKEVPIVFTNGYFDDLSAGHLRFIQEMRQFPGRVVVAINSDQSIFNKKGGWPLLREKDRARLLGSLESVDWVIVFEGENASDLIKTLRPQWVVKGERYKGISLPEQAAIEEVKAKVVFLPHFSW